MASLERIGFRSVGPARQRGEIDPDGRDPWPHPFLHNGRGRTLLLHAAAALHLQAEVEAPSFKRYVQEGITLAAGQVADQKGP